MQPSQLLVHTEAKMGEVRSAEPLVRVEVTGPLSARVWIGEFGEADADSTLQEASAVCPSGGSG